MDDHVDEMAEAQHERTAGVVETLREELEGMSYPVESSEVQAAYAEGRIDVPNETESMGDAFDRLADTTYESEQEVREAVLGELAGEAGEGREADLEYNEERDLETLDDHEHDE